MTRLFAFLFVLFVSLPAFAQQPYNPERGPQQWNRDDHRPRWCQMYDRRDYWREMRACGDDRSCRYQVRRKGERCGLR